MMTVENLFRFSKFQVTILLPLFPLRILLVFTRGARDLTNMPTRQRKPRPWKSDVDIIRVLLVCFRKVLFSCF